MIITRWGGEVGVEGLLGTKWQHQDCDGPIPCYRNVITADCVPCYRNVITASRAPCYKKGISC